MNRHSVSILVLAFSAAAFAQAPDSAAADTTSQARLERKLDRMDSKIDLIQEDVRLVRDEAILSPLGKRKWGVEFNPSRLLQADGDGYSLSGGVSNFSWDRSAEIAFPFVLWDISEEDGGGSSFIYTQDAHYRKFLSGRQRGFYLGAYVRYQHARYSDIFLFEEEGGRQVVNRGGLAFEVGGRVFSRSGFYWGWSVSAGRYLVGDMLDDREGFPNNPALWLGDAILDVELLKFGFAF